jgi:phosphopantothenoylcysteine synthetase/decarboxylase
MSLENKSVVIGVCGSIAAYKSCDIIRGLIRLGANVESILTNGGAKFITSLTLQVLSKNKVYSGMFDIPDSYEINHISLAKKADIIVVAPATADVIASLACGKADDLLTCTILASKVKILICPAMNYSMLNHKATQNNIEVLKGYGYKFAIPDKGELACGDCGDGRLASVKTILSIVEGLCL